MRRTISILFVFVAVLALTGGLPGGSVSAPPLPNPCDFVTGGGFIVRDNGAHGNFGVAGGCKNGNLWGHFEYVDHGSGLAPATAPTPFRVHGTGVTGYFSPLPDPKIREISGTAETNDPTFPLVDYCVRVTDNGEPGVNNDEFVIRLSVFGVPIYTTEFNPNSLGGGNIQLHKPNPSTTGSFSSSSCLFNPR